MKKKSGTYRDATGKLVRGIKCKMRKHYPAGKRPGSAGGTAGHGEVKTVLIDARYL